MKKSLLLITILAFSIALPASLTAEQITTVGIIDVNKVAQVFFRESQAVRELEEMAMRIQEEIDNITEEIREGGCIVGYVISQANGCAKSFWIKLDSIFTGEFA